MRPRSRYGGGFTLMELAVVVLLIAIVLAIALPRVMPALAFGELDGAARRLANYGRASVAHAALRHERLTIVFDLDSEAQQYWALRRTSPLERRMKEQTEKEREKNTLFSEDIGLSLREMGAENIEKMLADRQQDKAAAMADAVRERFDQLFIHRVEAGTRNIKHEGILDGVAEDLFSEDSLFEDEEEKEVELKTSLLSRTALPPDVRIESIRTGGKTVTDGTFEVEVSPLGLSGEVVFVLRGQYEDDYYTVIWDPITSSARIQEGQPPSAGGES